MFDIFLFSSVFFFGLIVGSFLNCVIYRLETGENFLKGRSFCPHCKHVLSWRDLIPVFSFIFLGGKCGYCHQKISLQYPLVEIATGMIFLLIFRLFFLHTAILPVNCLSLIYYWVISAFLIVIFVYDLKHYIIPDKIIYPAIIIAGIFNFQYLITKQSLIFNYSILAAVGATAFFLFIVLVSRGRWMGVGDIKLAFLMGLVLGWPNILVALLLAFYIGAIAGLALIVYGRKKLKSEIPFAPFLVTGTFLALLWGDELINWYQGIFLVK